MLKKLIKRLSTNRWALGFVRGGMEAVMESDHLEIDWVKMPKDCWMADPFVLDVTDNEILLFVEEMPYAVHKGIITLLHIDRKSMKITSRKVLLETSTHLSFPTIWRKDGHIYIYPENAQSGKLDLYEFNAKKEELSFVKTICDDVVWDSFITEAFGEPLMFTAAQDDYHLDIYQWNKKKERFVSCQQVISDIKNSRMGGAVFEYKGQYYYPAQNCEKTYGGAIDIKRIDVMRRDKSLNEPHALNDVTFSFETVKHIESPNKRYPLGLHTLNEYKGAVVIDVKGYRYGWLGAVVSKLAKIKKQISHADK